MNIDERVMKFAIQQGLDLNLNVDMVQLTSKLVGIQSQLADTPIISARARGLELDSKSLKELYKNKLLERIWTVRGTMHTIASEDWSLFQKALEPEWKLRWSTFMDKHITKDQQTTLEKWILNKVSYGPITRKELINKAISAYGNLSWVNYAFSSWGGLLKSLSYKNKICLRPGTEVNEYVMREDVGMNDTLHLSSNAALRELYKRYINAYGPANVNDFVYWSGTTVRRVKEAINRDDYLQCKDKIRMPNKTFISILPKFDPYVLSHKNKFYLDEAFYPLVYKKAGHIEAVILKNGLIIGTWKKKNGLLYNYSLFDKYNINNSEIKKETIRMNLLKGRDLH